MPVSYLFTYKVEVVKMFFQKMFRFILRYYDVFLEEDQLKEQAKDFEKMKNLMEVFSSEHIKGNDSIFLYLAKRTEHF